LPRRIAWLAVRCSLRSLAFAAAIAASGAASAQPDAARGLRVIVDQGCAACHRIPGAQWPVGRVGPPLDGFGRRTYIAGVLPNSPEALARWLRDPPSVKPGTAMPNVGLTEAQASDVAAYLSGLK